jgi:hypothetical protein
MKRFLTFALAGAFVLCLSGTALAVDVNVSGTWEFAFGWVKHESFHDNDNEYGNGADDFLARQRLRTQAEFIVSERLKGVLMMEIGDSINWGRDEDGKIGNNSGGGLDTDGVNVATKLAYVDWALPSTEVSVRMGLQYIVLPDAVGRGNPILNSDVAALAVNVPFSEQVSLTAIWARPFDAFDRDDAGGRSLADEMDIFALILPVSGEGWSVTPWGAYSRAGASSGLLEYAAGGSGANDAFALPYDLEEVSFSGDDSADIWWGGLALEVSAFDPLTFGLNAMYGHMGRLEYDFDDGTNTGKGDFRTAGWLFAATVDYKLDWGSIGLFGWYSSGDDEDDAKDGEYGRLPAIGFDNGFAPTGFGGPGSAGNGSDTALSATFLGTWGIGIQLADWSFVEDLSHTLRFAYYRGTNDHEVVERGYGLAFSGENVYLTDKDSAFEINFDHTYNIYENLSMVVELGYIYLDLDEGVWDDTAAGRDYADTSSAWKAQLLFMYNF